MTTTREQQTAPETTAATRPARARRERDRIDRYDPPEIEPRWQGKWEGMGQIGRAPGRERGEISGGAGSLKKKKDSALARRGPINGQLDDHTPNPRSLVGVLRHPRATRGRDDTLDPSTARTCRTSTLQRRVFS